MKLHHLVDKGNGFEFDGRMLTIGLSDLDQGASTIKIGFEKFKEMVEEELGINVSYALENSLPENEFFTLTVLDGSYSITNFSSYSITNFSSCLFVQGNELVLGKPRTLTTGEIVEFAGITFQIEL